MRLNVATKPIYTHEGAPAKHINAEQALRRSVMSCLLWEAEFYEDGQEIGQRIAELARQVPPEAVARMAIEAREQANLRHAPLLLLDALSETGKPILAATVERTIQRVDEMPEMLAIYWRNGRKPVARQLRKGLARAFAKFDEYALAKYNRKGTVKLRDVLRIARPKPADDAQSALWKRVKDGTLETPDTWEVALSGGADKRETFERLIREGMLGYLALLRNLRNMAEAGVDPKLVNEAIIARKGARRVLPFRYVAAARAAPQFEPALDQALCEAIAEMPMLSGKTAILVDVSRSMEYPLSARSDMERMDAAAALASIAHGDLRVFSFSGEIVEVPPRRGMAGVDAVVNSQRHGGTYLGAAVKALNEQVPHDRLIVVTDEQSHDRVPDPIARHVYMINVASNRNGIGYGRWTHIDGFSEAVFRFIHEHERATTD